MRFGLFSLFRESPFTKLLEHAEKVQEGGELFRAAIKCYLESDCIRFEELHLKVASLESEADRIKQNIRAHLPKGGGSNSQCPRHHHDRNKNYYKNHD